MKLEPESGEANYQLGLALVRAGRKEEAAAQLKKGRELVAADDRAQNALLDIADGRAALDEAISTRPSSKFRRASPAAAGIVGAAAAARRGAGAQGDVAGAAAAYEKALELNPQDAAARRSLEHLKSRQRAGATRATGGWRRQRRWPHAGFRRVRLGRPRASDGARGLHPRRQVGGGRAAAARNTWRSGRSPPGAGTPSAIAYFAQKKIGESIKALAKSLQLDLKNAEAHKILGRNLMIIGRFDAAQIEFEQAIRYKPDSAESHYNLGKLFSIQDNWEPARKAFEAALRIDPSYLEALDGLGFALEALGDDAGAVAKYQEAIALNEARGGQFASAHVNLSAYYNRTGDPAKALEYARKAIELDPKSDRAWFQKAKADEREGRLNDAVSALNEAISYNPRASSYYYVLAGVYRRLGWMDESRKALEHFKRLDQGVGRAREEASQRRERKHAPRRRGGSVSSGSEPRPIAPRVPATRRRPRSSPASDRGFAASPSALPRRDAPTGARASSRT